MMRRDPHPYGARPDLESDRRVQPQRLTVHTGRDRVARPNLEPRRGPCPPPGETRDLACALERDQPRRFRCILDLDRDDSEDARVEPLTTAEAAQPLELIDVVRDEHQIGVTVLDA